MKQPTEADYKRLEKIIRKSGFGVNDFDLRDMGYEGGDLCMFLQYRLDLLVAWLAAFIEFLPGSPHKTVQDGFKEGGEGYKTSRVTIVLKSEGGMDFSITGTWQGDTNLAFADYLLSLKWEESFERCAMPELNIVGRKWEHMEGDLFLADNNQYGFTKLARKIVQLDSM